MDLERAMQFQSTSAINPFEDNRFRRQLYSVLKGTEIVPHWLEYASSIIASSIKNDQILMRQPVNAIKIVGSIDNDPNVVGRYDPDSRTIIIKENAAMRVYAFLIFFHEFGHHLSEMYLNPKRASDAGADLAMVRTYQSEIVFEYNEAIAKLSGRAGIRKNIDLNDIDDDWQFLWKLPEFGPSRYSYRNFKEWLGEVWTWYFTGEREWLKQRFPATYSAVNAVAHGAILARLS